MKRTLKFLLVYLSIINPWAYAIAGEGGGTSVGGGGQIVEVGGRPVLRELAGKKTCQWVQGAKFASSLNHWSTSLESIRPQNWYLALFYLRESSRMNVCLTEADIIYQSAEDLDGFTAFEWGGKQVAIRYGNEVYIDTKILDQMDDLNRVYLWIHELSHQLVRANVPRRYMRLRSFVSALASNEAQAMTPVDFAYQLKMNQVDILMDLTKVNPFKTVLEAALDPARDKKERAIAARIFCSYSIYPDTEYYEDIFENSSRSCPKAGVLALRNEDAKELYELHFDKVAVEEISQSLCNCSGASCQKLFDLGMSPLVYAKCGDSSFKSLLTHAVLENDVALVKKYLDHEKNASYFQYPLQQHVWPAPVDRFNRRRISRRSHYAQVLLISGAMDAMEVGDQGAFMNWIHWMKAEPQLQKWYPYVPEIPAYLFKKAMARGMFDIARALQKQGWVDLNTLQLSFYELLMSGKVDAIRILRDEMGLDLNGVISLQGAFKSLSCTELETKIPMLYHLTQWEGDNADFLSRLLWSKDWYHRSLGQGRPFLCFKSDFRMIDLVVVGTAVAMQDSANSLNPPDMLLPLRTFAQLKGVRVQSRFTVHVAEVNKAKPAIYGRFGRLVSTEVKAGVSGVFSPGEFIQQVQDTETRGMLLSLLNQVSR